MSQLMLLAAFATLLAGVGLAAAADATAPRDGAGKPLAVFCSQSKEFMHDVVNPAKSNPTLADQLLNKLAAKADFALECTQDAATLTPEKLKNTQLVVFYTTGNLPWTDEQFKAFDQWIQDGGAFLGIHTATDTFHKPPFHDGYQKIIGGEFVGHPWNQDGVVTLKVLDEKHPATSKFPKDFTHQEEIYQHKGFDPAQVRVVLGLDMEKTALKKPFFVPIAWCKEYGKGKVFYSSLGHRPDILEHEAVQQHLVGAIQWLLGREPGDASPNPEISQREEEIARKAAGESPSAKP